MSSEQASLIAVHPFIRRFVYAILQNVEINSVDRGERYVIHADMVPKVSARVMKRSMEIPRVVPRAPVVVMPPVMSPRPPVHRPVVPVVPSKFQIVPPVPSGNVELGQDYGKLMPLLGDVSVSTIECQGAGKPLMVIRAGRRQLTRISLGTGEIKDILDKVSDAVHIPILEGVFRAAVDNFSINAVVSEIIGSRFVIKKQTAYALLER